MKIDPLFAVDLIPRPRIRVALLSASALLASGCTNLAAVGDISNNLTSASSSWDDVVSDVYASCERRIYYSSKADDNCVQEKAASQGLKSANKVLREYFKALGQAASGNTFTINSGIGDVATSVAKIPGVDNDKVEAATELAQFLSQLFLDSKRERTIRLLIDDAGPNAGKVVELLQSNMVDRLDRALTIESAGLNVSFETWLAHNKFAHTGDVDAFCEEPKSKMFSNDSDGINMLLVEAYCQRAQSVETKRAALKEYATSLETARKALDELQSSRTKLKSKELARKLYTIGGDLKDQVEAVDKAFG